MDLSQKYEVERLINEKNFGSALMTLTEMISNLKGKNFTLSNGFMFWATSQRSLCFRQLGQMSFAYSDAKRLIREKPTEETGYLRKSEVELELGLTGDAVNTLSVWQYKRRGTESNEGAAARQQLKLAREKHKASQEEQRKVKWKALAFGVLMGVSLALWLCRDSNVLLLTLCGAVFAVVGAGLSRLAVAGMQKVHDHQRRATLSDLLEDVDLD